MKVQDRACGICEVRDIPFGVDWPYWNWGRPVHPICLAMKKLGAQTIDLPEPLPAKPTATQSAHEEKP